MCDEYTESLVTANKRSKSDGVELVKKEAFQQKPKIFYCSAYQIFYDMIKGIFGCDNFTIIFV